LVDLFIEMENVASCKNDCEWFESMLYISTNHYHALHDSAFLTRSKQALLFFTKNDYYSVTLYVLTLVPFLSKISLQR